MFVTKHTWSQELTKQQNLQCPESHCTACGHYTQAIQVNSLRCPNCPVKRLPGAFAERKCHPYSCSFFLGPFLALIPGTSPQESESYCIEMTVKLFLSFLLSPTSPGMKYTEGWELGFWGFPMPATIAAACSVRGTLSY